MPSDDVHSDLPDFGELSAMDALAIVVGELRVLQRELARLGAVERELARLRDAVRRPERILYRPEEAARRLKVGRTKLYDLWNSGVLAYNRDRVGTGT